MLKHFRAMHDYRVYTSPTTRPSYVHHNRLYIHLLHITRKNTLHFSPSISFTY